MPGSPAPSHAAETPIDPPLAAALAGLDASGAAMVARTLAWSAINSGSRELAGLKRMQAPLLDALAALPGEVGLAPLEETERVSARGDIEATAHAETLRLRVRPQAPIQVALTGHYDTVFPASHPFQTPVVRADGALHGPGVADMKGGIAVMLAALEAFEATPQAGNVGYEVLLNPDEEIGSPASAPLLKALGARAHVGMTYEPAMATGALVSTRKGSGNYALIVKGRAAHVGRAFGEGRNAVVAAAEAALALNALNAVRPDVTFNVGAIDGGGAVNIVPDRGVLRLNVRAPDLDAQAWAESEIGKIVRALEAKEGLSVHLHGGFSRPPKPLSPALETLIGWTREAGAALGLSLQFGPSGGVCEGNNLAAAGCMNIDTLGPCGGALHSDQEFALPETFPERAKLSLLLLHGFASGRWDPRKLRA
ncbi:MAG: hydrolase [Hyphomonadaceae bacterium]|nr:hydrolase [Hyphomonadaceae bacterium]